MTAQAQMQFLGVVNGDKWYWAAPGKFTVPGVYYWDGKQNVHVTAAPTDAKPYCWCIASMNSADWAFAATRDDVIENAKLMDADCIKTAPFPLHMANPTPPSVRDAAQPIAPEDTSAGDKIRLIREAENFVPPSDAMDARRYRFVREHGYVELVCKSPRANGWSPAKLDSAIDAALAATMAPGKDSQ